MLKRIAVETVLLATDLDACRDFYEGSLELPVVATAATSFTVRSGTSRIRVSRSTTGTRDQQTKCIWTDGTRRSRRRHVAGHARHRPSPQ